MSYKICKFAILKRSGVEGIISSSGGKETTMTYSGEHVNTGTERKKGRTKGKEGSLQFQFQFIMLCRYKLKSLKESHIIVRQTTEKRRAKQQQNFVSTCKLTPNWRKWSGVNLLLPSKHFARFVLARRGAALPSKQTELV